MRVIQAIWGDVPSHIIPCLDSVRKIYPHVEVFLFDGVENPLYESDKWRWQMMLENDDILYLDWDISLTDQIVFNQNGLASMMYYMGHPDNCLMYSPKMNLFRAFEDERVRRGIQFETMGWFRKVLRDKKINELVGITHLRTSGIKELINQYSKLTQGVDCGRTKTCI